MFKKILMSGLVLGALAATVGGATYAPWSDAATGTGTITAAVIDIEVDGGAPGEPDAFGLVFIPQDLLPGESSSDTFTLDNVGTRDVSLTYLAAPSGGTVLCPAGWLTPITVTGPATLTPADPPAVVTVSATLDSGAPIDCMGVTFTVTVTVTGTGV